MQQYFVRSVRGIATVCMNKYTSNTGNVNMALHVIPGRLVMCAIMVSKNLRSLYAAYACSIQDVCNPLPVFTICETTYPGA